ncbi:MAG TPA: ABC transporter ATP-binding protein [Myxococcales bacterium]|nr:ABC transporter [Deltaproteobacteria bacterium]HAA58220.1 ABC transporter ATP-binding protein [Myxococcales bacterium]
MTGTQERVIELKGLTKHFGDFHAVKDVSFSVTKGEIFGFMGHNGAGKTSTIKMLLGLSKPTAGTAEVLGHDILHESLALRQRCGFLPASYSLPKDMTPTTFLTYIASMFGRAGAPVKRKIDELLDFFGLADVKDKKLGGFSTGMAQKVGLAQALINEPEVIFLDEPTAGLDPLGRHDFLQYMKTLSTERGVTVMFSTHILTDIESICEHVAILHQGKLIADGHLNALKQQHQSANMDEMYLKLVREAMS